MRLRFAVQSSRMPEARDPDCGKGRCRWSSCSPDRIVPAALRNRHRARACARPWDLRSTRNRLITRPGSKYSTGHDSARHAAALEVSAQLKQRRRLSSRARCLRRAWRTIPFARVRPRPSARQCAPSTDYCVRLPFGSSPCPECR